MPSVLSINAKNELINLLTGYSGTRNYSYLTYGVPYNGLQPADPSVTPVGSAAAPGSYSYGYTLSGAMTAAAGGISSLAAPKAFSQPSYAAGLGALTFVRFYCNSYPMLDVPVSLNGGGGGAILASLTSVVGIGVSLDKFSIKIAQSLGTLSINAPLANRLVDWLTYNATAMLYMGINTSGTCVLDIYSGAPPASADDAATGTKLASITIGGTQLWGSASGGSAALVVSPSVTSLASGTIGYARLKKTLGSVDYIIQGTAGTSGTDFVLNTATTVDTSTTVQLTAATLSI